MNKFIIEFLGTFFLVLIVSLTGNPIATGLALAALVYMGGYISGAHYNPAVTLAVLIRGKIKKYEALKYLVAQTLGAFFGAFVFFLITNNLFIPKTNPSFSLVSAGLVEFLMTFLLAFVVLHTATSEKTKGNQYYGLAIGFTLLVGVAAGGRISGGVYNPAISLGTLLFDFTNLPLHLSTLAFYLSTQFLGGLMAGFIYKITK